jgi:hypothetical protein
MNSPTLLIILTSVVVRSLELINETSLRRILTCSSISHTEWILTAILGGIDLWLLYYVVYSILTSTVSTIAKSYNITFVNQTITVNKRTVKLLLFTRLLSLPLIGFLPNVLGQNVKQIMTYSLIFPWRWWLCALRNFDTTACMLQDRNEHPWWKTRIFRGIWGYVRAVFNNRAGYLVRSTNYEFPLCSLPRRFNLWVLNVMSQGISNPEIAIVRPLLWSSGQSSRPQLLRPVFDSRHFQISWDVVGLERGPLSLVSTTEDLLERKSSGSGLESREYGRREPSHWPRGTLYQQRLALTSPISGGGRLVEFSRWLRPRSSFIAPVVERVYKVVGDIEELAGFTPTDVCGSSEWTSVVDIGNQYNELTA